MDLLLLIIVVGLIISIIDFDINNTPDKKSKNKSIMKWVYPIVLPVLIVIYGITCDSGGGLGSGLSCDTGAFMYFVMSMPISIVWYLFLMISYYRKKRSDKKDNFFNSYKFLFLILSIIIIVNFIWFDFISSLVFNIF